MMWFGFTLAATVLSTAGQLLVKGSSGSPLLLACILGMTTGTLGLIGTLMNAKEARTIAPRSAGAVVLAGAIFFAANVLWLHAIQRTPNLSLVRGIMAGGEIVIIAILAYLVYRQKLTQKQVVGIALIVVGIALSMPSRSSTSAPSTLNTAVTAAPT